MPNYRRAYTPGGTIFLTLVTYNRQPLFSHPENVQRLRQVTAQVKAEMPFEIVGTVVLPDHLHAMWTLAPNDSNYSKRVGRLKALFTQSLRGKDGEPLAPISASRQRHREQDVWQRRFWEHTIRDQSDWIRHLNYVHYNPVKHGLVSCPHLWMFSSFWRYVRLGVLAADWGCCCGGRVPEIEAVGDGWMGGE